MTTERLCSENFLDPEELYPDLVPAWVIPEDTGASTDEISTRQDSSQALGIYCRECERHLGCYYCANCHSVLCISCTGAIHVLKDYAHHAIRYVVPTDTRAFPPLGVTPLAGLREAEAFRLRDARFDPTLDHLSPSSPIIPSHLLDSTRAPLKPLKRQHSQPKFNLGQDVFFHTHELGDLTFSHEYSGVVVQRERRVSEPGEHEYRVLWARGVRKLMNGFYQASLTFVDKQRWPVEIRQYANLWHAIQVVGLGEDVAIRIWSRERLAGRDKAPLSNDLVSEIMSAVTVEIDRAQVEMIEDGLRSPQEFLAHVESGGSLPTCFPFRLDSSEIDRFAPWQPSERLRYFSFAQSELESVEEVQPRRMTVVVQRMFYQMLGYALEKWQVATRESRQAEREELEDRSVRCMQRWIRRLARSSEGPDPGPTATNHHLAHVMEQKRELEQEQNVRHEALLMIFQVCQEVLFRIQERRFRCWKQNVGPLESYPIQSAAMKWHPVIGIGIPKLPKVWASSTLEGGLDIQDYAKFKQFKRNHAGPTDSSYWAIPGRVLAGKYPEGQAFSSKKKFTSKSDAIASILLQRISVFVCCMTSAEQEALYHPASGITLEKVIAKRKQRLESELNQAAEATQKKLQLYRQNLDNYPKELPKDTEEYDHLQLKHRLAQEQYESAEKLKQHVVPEHTFLHLPLCQDTCDPQRDFAQLELYLEQIESFLRQDRNVYIFSTHGHGRTGLLTALLLGRLYGLEAHDALERAQRCHDAQWRASTNKSQTISSPQSLAQVQMCRQILAHTSAPIYHEISTVGPDSTLVFRRRQVCGSELDLAKAGFMISEVLTDEQREWQVGQYQRQRRMGCAEVRGRKIQHQRKLCRMESHAMHLADLQSRLLAEDYRDESRSVSNKLQLEPLV